MCSRFSSRKNLKKKQKIEIGVEMSTLFPAKYSANSFLFDSFITSKLINSSAVGEYNTICGLSTGSGLTREKHAPDTLSWTTITD